MESDASLMAAVQSGDRTAIDLLHRNHNEYVLRLLEKRRVDAFTADDISQLIWLKVWLKAGTFDLESRFRPWLASITVRTLVDHKRAEKRKRVVLCESIHPEFDIADRTERAVDMGSIRSIASRLVSRMRYGAAAVDAMLNGMTPTEFSESQNIPYNTGRWQFAVVAKTLRQSSELSVIFD